MTGWAERALDLLLRHRRGVVVVVALTVLRSLTDLGLGASGADEAYVATLAALLCGWCLLLVARIPDRDRAGSPVATRQRLDARPERLSVLESSAVLWVKYAGLVHHRLRPSVWMLVVDRLTRAGRDPDAPADVAAALGPTTWSLVRPDRPVPGDDDAAGLRPDELERLTAELTALLPSETRPTAVPAPVPPRGHVP